MSQPLVDLTVAVHARTRPILGAVASVVDHNSAHVRVNVVAHNIEPEIIRQNLGAYGSDSRVRLLSLRDGIPSPAGPFNYGLDHSTARFVSVMGSDDELEPGAVDSWLRLQQSTGAAVVIARIRHAGGATVASPPVRLYRRRNLDPVKDRLSYRSAPLGLISREAFGDVRFSEGLSSGEDVPYATRLWFSGNGIAFDTTGPSYLVHDEADDRVTSEPRSVQEDFEFLDKIFDDPWFRRFDKRQRRALVVKLLRTHLFDAVLNRSNNPEWVHGERDELAAITVRILAWANHPERVLSRIDRRALKAILDPDVSIAELLALIKSRWNYRSPAAILTKNPLYLLHRQAPLRTFAAGYLVTRP